MKRTHLAILPLILAIGIPAQEKSEGKPKATPPRYDAGLTCVHWVTDLDKSIAFYTGVLGFELLYKIPEMGWCELQTPVPGVGVGLGRQEKVTAGGGAVLTWGVLDIEESAARLKQAGVKAAEIETIPDLVRLLAASAQSRPTWPELRAQLRSSDPAQAAWAAHHVAEGRLSQAGPDLTHALDRLRGRERFDGEIELALALLDAAVRCGAKLPSQALARWAAVPECVTALLAYAAREPADMAPVVRAILGATADQATWVAACNLLLASDPRSLVTAVLAHSGIHVQVEVVAAGAIARGTAMSVSYGKDLSARLGVDGFPPVPRYRILPEGLPEQAMGDPSDSLAVDGPDRLFLVRVTEDKARQGTFHFGTLPSRADYAVRCLDWLVPRRDGAPPLGRHTPQRHEWRDVDTWNSAVVTPVVAMRDHQIVDWLTAQRMVDATQAAALRASFHIEVSDQRVDRSKPLPEIK